MVLDNSKYVVFKAEDAGGFVLGFEQVVIDDAVVIRRQDIFAGPGLYAYANAIQTAIDLLNIEADAISQRHNEQWFFDPKQRKHLEELRDFFHEQAQMAADHPQKKVPD